MTQYDAPTDVYRLFGASWDLLYVGISRNAFHRLRQHRSMKVWWPDVYWVQIFRYNNRYVAEAVEAAAIATEAPRYNVDPGSLRARVDSWVVPRATQFEIDYFDEHISEVA